MKNKLTINDIVDKKFSSQINGYDPLEVDQFLDKIVILIQNMENNIETLKNAEIKLKKELQKCQEANELLKIKIEDLEIKNNKKLN